MFFKDIASQRISDAMGKMKKSMSVDAGQDSINLIAPQVPLKKAVSSIAGSKASVWMDLVDVRWRLWEKIAQREDALMNAEGGGNVSWRILERPRTTFLEGFADATMAQQLNTVREIKFNIIDI